MYLEHAIWTLVVCVIAGMFYANYPRDRNPVWIIWFAMLIPDSDFIAQTFWEEIFPYKTTVLFVHGQFHNIMVLTLAVIVVGWLVWRYTKITYKDAAICVGIGFIAHLLEDALVNGVEYHFYFPFSDRGWYQGFILTPTDDIVFAHSVYASSNIAVIGFCLLILMILFRSNIQGYDWLKKFNPYPAFKRWWNALFQPDLLTMYGLPYDDSEPIFKQNINRGKQWTQKKKQ
jgi:hypothetical protein